MTKSKKIEVELGFWVDKDEYIQEAMIALEAGCKRLADEYMELLNTKGKTLADLGYSIEITYELGYNSIEIFSYLNEKITYQKVKDAKMRMLK